MRGVECRSLRIYAVIYQRRKVWYAGVSGCVSRVGEGVEWYAGRYV